MYDAGVPMLSSDLKGEPRSNGVQRVGEGDSGKSRTRTGHELVTVLYQWYA